MITIKLADDLTKDKLNINHNAFIIENNNDLAGYCEFKLSPPDVFIQNVNCDDVSLLDGLLRQTLSYSLDNNCTVAKYTENVKLKLYLLKIIKNECECELDILSFFTNFNHCEKN